MAYLGKTYNHSKDENFDDYLASLGIPAEKLEVLKNSKPTSKLEKNGDTYILTSTDPHLGSREMKFQNDVEFNEEVLAGIFATTKFTVDGDVVTQTQTLGDGRVLTFKREYSGNSMVVTLSISTWDGSARRHYVEA